MSASRSSNHVLAQGAHHTARGAGQLLIVDDEPQICRSLQRILRRDGYEIFTAGSASEAFDILAAEAIDVIVSDQRMPHVKGTEFLNEVMQRYPNTVRMILSGAAELDDITSAMTAGAIYKFLTKPIDPGLLRANVAEGFSRAATMGTAALPSEQIEGADGLSTRKLVESEYLRLASEQTSSGCVPCLILLQVDQHSNVVASFGSSFGEHFMATIAELLQLGNGTDCYVCREGRSSFLLLTADASPEERLAELKDRLDRIFSEPVVVSGRRLTPTVSMGGTSPSSPDLSFDELLDQARTAVMTASMRGGATMQIYQEDLLSAWRDRLQLESDLRQAVTDKAFGIHYQPQVDVETGHIVGLEALLRWPHPDHGFVSPAEFVPVAEQLGLIRKLGSWVLEAAVADFIEWDRASLAPRELAVNVSAFQMRDMTLVTRLGELLKRTELEPARLVLEITETAAIAQDKRIEQCLEGMRGLGVTLAVDDFGTGYANLSLLNNLDFRKLKLDRSLLPVCSEDRSTRLFTNVVAMAQELGLELVAEGVETPAELAAVYKAGCRVVQGYFYSPPVNSEKLGTLLLNQFTDRHLDLAEA